MAITLSERALVEICRIIEEQDLPEDTYLRVSILGGGCSGFSYRLGFDNGNIASTDQIFEQDGMRVVCDPKSLLYLNETEIGFEESLMGRGFTFRNPNARNSCGCGESFSI
jgi:iron-sulfur cluster assembly protein